MALIELGTVVAPSGVLLVVDPGYLRMWSDDRPPVLPDGILPDAETTERANRSVDLEIVGRDAEVVGRKLDMQWHPRWLFDFPRESIEELALRIADLGTLYGLDARLVLPALRVTHRRRVALALEHGGGAGEVMFHGVWAAAISDLPAGPLRVVGEPMPGSGPDAARLRRVVIEARDGAVARSERVGYVAVDRARLLAVDVEALGAFTPDELDSATLTRGAARGVGFETTWGDGVFEVFRDLDADGRLLRVNVELGTAERQGLMRRLELRWKTTALVSRKIVDEGQPVGFMFREAPEEEDDSGWRIMAGSEDDAYRADPDNVARVRLSAFAGIDAAVDARLDAAVGSAFERRPGRAELEPVEGWG